MLAGAVLVFAVLSSGLEKFWHQFLHGLNVTMTTQTALLSFVLTSGLFAAILVFFWISTLFKKALDAGKDAPVDAPVRTNRLAAIKLAFVCAAPVFLIAFGLNWGCSHLLEWVIGTAPADQDLVKCLMAPHEPLGLRILLCLAVLFGAPLTEEPLFRGIIFRGFLPVLPPWGAMALSGFFFALVHVNAATFIPLWYLGVVFAWTYWKTGSILAPMTLHMLFNGVNLFLLFFFPELAT